MESSPEPFVMAFKLFKDAIELRGDPVSPRLVTGLIELPPDVPVRDPVGETCKLGLLPLVIAASVTRFCILIGLTPGLTDKLANAARPCRLAWLISLVPVGDDPVSPNPVEF